MAGQIADISAVRWMCKTSPELKAGQFVGVWGGHMLSIPPQWLDLERISQQLEMKTHS